MKPTLTLIRYVKADRNPSTACYGPGDVCGVPLEVSARLVAQGFAVLEDAGRGPGVVNPDAGGHHMQEVWESTAEFLRRGGRPEDARPPEPIAVEAAKAGKIRGMLGG